MLSLKTYEQKGRIFEGICLLIYDSLSFFLKSLTIMFIVINTISFSALLLKNSFASNIQNSSLVISNYNSLNNNKLNLEPHMFIQNGQFVGHSNDNNINSHQIILDKNKKTLIIFKFDEVYTSYPSTAKFENINKFVNFVINTFSQDSDNIETALILTSGGGNAYFFERSYSNLRRLSNHGFKSYALIDTICASGCYMMACACDKIIASNSSTIGSIGVFTKRYNGQKFSEMIGVEEIIFKTSNKKGDIPFLGKASNESLDHIQNKINKTMKKFVSIVKKGRPLADEKLFDADVMYAEEALKNNLVDSVEMTEDFLRRKSFTHNILIVEESQQNSFLNKDNIMGLLLSIFNFNL